MSKLRKHELVVVCRAHGWKGNESRLETTFFTTWLAQHNVTEQMQHEIVKRFRTGNINSSSGAVQAPSTGITQTQVLQMIEDALPPAGAALDQDAIRTMVNEAVKKMSPDKIIVNESTGAQVKVEGVHPLFDKVLKLVLRGVNVMLVGPAGCGKTTMAHHIAKALKREFGMLSCTSGASESQLTGWLLPIGQGKQAGSFTYVPSEFVRLYEKGTSVYLFDEFDAADPNMLLVINSALANGSLHVPQRHERPLVNRGKNVTMIAAANTFGSGADMVYAGRNQLDAATLDRFYVIEMDYDKALEVRLGEKAVVEWAHDLRDKVKMHRVRRVISTRTIMKMSEAIRAGVSFNEARKDMLAGWSKDEITKVGA